MPSHPNIGMHVEVKDPDEKIIHSKVVQTVYSILRTSASCKLTNFLLPAGLQRRR